MLDENEDVVVLTVVPNASLAEMLCGELGNEGIPARTMPASVIDPGGPCQIVVRRNDAERARALLPD
jgi:hypothetical protein